MLNMTDKELIGYCELHCETPRALFSRIHVNRMLALAGHPEGWAKEVPQHMQFVAVHEEMKELCAMARERIKQGGAKLYKFPQGATHGA